MSRSSLRSLLLSALVIIVTPLSLTSQVPQPRVGLINRDAAIFSERSKELYIVNTANDAVMAIRHHEEPKLIKVGSQPDALAINNRTGMLYAVNPGSRTVSIIDTSKDEVIATVPTAARPYAIAVDEVRNRVYVSNTFSNILTVVDGATNEASGLKVGSADVILVDSDRRRVYLLGYESNALTELNPDDGATRKIPAGAMHLWGLARAGRTLYVTHIQDASIAAIDLDTHITQSIATGQMPCAIAQDHARRELYVANYADGTVTVLRDDKAIATVRVAAHPQSLSVDSANGLLYVASPQENSVTIVDLRRYRRLKSLQVTGHPYAVGIVPGTGAAYAVTHSQTPFTAFNTIR